MGEDPEPNSATKHYFVDEAGDPTLFDRKGNVIAGVGGCSRFFMMGVLDAPDPSRLSARVTELHHQIISDPFYSGIESLRPERKKTYLHFHAVDDLPEIRERVFRLLVTEDFRFHAVVRDKRGLSIDVQNKNRQSAAYRYHPNKLYDEMVTRLFKDLLHKGDGHRVCFARRGSKDRTAALRTALEQARENFRRKWNLDASLAPIEVSACAAIEDRCLQVVDYCLWALQRAYSAGEDRFVRFIWPHVGVIHDVDDRRENRWGRYYNAARPLTAEEIKRPAI